MILQSLSNLVLGDIQNYVLSSLDFFNAKSQSILSANSSLGVDLELDQNGDIVGTLSGSLFLISGVENVAQSIRTNITTIPTQYYWGQTVGTDLGKHVDDPLTDYEKTIIQNTVYEKVSQDSRIVEVLGVNLDDSNQDTLIVTIDAVVSSVGTVQIPVVIGGV